MKINTKTDPTTFVQIFAPTSMHSEDEIDYLNDDKFIRLHMQNIQ